MAMFVTLEHLHSSIDWRNIRFIHGCYVELCWDDESQWHRCQLQNTSPAIISPGMCGEAWIYFLDENIEKENISHRATGDRFSLQISKEVIARGEYLEQSEQGVTRNSFSDLKVLDNVVN